MANARESLVASLCITYFGLAAATLVAVWGLAGVSSWLRTRKLPAPGEAGSR
jgi:hypothetical protein